MATRWSAATATVIPELAQRYPRTWRSSSAVWSTGRRTRPSKTDALRGSLVEARLGAGAWYSSSPSWRLSSWEETTTGASPESIVTSRVRTARCRSVIDTIRVESTRTRLPDGVRQTRERRSTPARKSSARS